MRTEHAVMAEIAAALNAPLGRLEFDRRYLQDKANIAACADVFGDVVESWLTVRNALTAAGHASTQALTSARMRDHLDPHRFAALRRVAREATTTL